MTEIDDENTEHVPYINCDEQVNKVEAFITAIHEDSQPPTTARDALRVTAVTEAAYESARAGEWADADLSSGDRVAVESEDSIGVHRRLTYQTLTQAAQDRLEATIEDIITANEQRFIDFYNNAQPIGLRKHQLDVLAGIGDTRREAIIDERRRGPFADFADLEAR